VGQGSVPVVRHTQLPSSVQQLGGAVRGASWGRAVAPQNAVSPGRGSSLLAGVPIIAEHVILVRRAEVGRPFLKALECLQAK
jgi:hypothetical protein